ncbi:hypothetical protein Emag_006847 [Eimeria magna]
MASEASIKSSVLLRRLQNSSVFEGTHQRRQTGQPLTQQQDKQPLACDFAQQQQQQQQQQQKQQQQQLK